MHRRLPWPGETIHLQAKNHHEYADHAPNQRLTAQDGRNLTASHTLVGRHRTQAPAQDNLADLTCGRGFRRTARRRRTDLRICEVVPAACPMRWSTEGCNGHSRTTPQASRRGFTHVSLLAEQT